MPRSFARWWAALLLTLLACLAATAIAQSFPPLTGRVVDNANLLSPAQEAELSARLEALEKSTGRQLVVTTLPDLQGYEIEDYGYQLGRAWGIGQKGQNNGIILLVAPNQHKVRIEVGYGLEPYVTDALSSTIIQDQILPKFKAGDFPGGIDAGVSALIAQLQLPEDQAQARQKQILDQAKPAQRTHRGSGVPLGLIFWIVVLGFVVLSHRRRRGPWGARRYGGGSNWPVWLWVASEIADSASRGRRSSGWSGGGDWGGGGGGGGFSGGGGSFGGGGASGSW